MTKLPDVALSRKRPIWVWIIAIYQVITVALSWCAMYVTASSIIPGTQKFSATEYSLSILIGILCFLGALVLFFLRKHAFHIFTAALAVQVISTVWQFTFGWLSAGDSSLVLGAIGALFSWGLLIAVCWYIRRLIRAGVLI